MIRYVQLVAFLVVLLVPLQSRGSIVINEIHADPAADLSGDANGDGVRSATHDEFIELLNTGLSSVDIGGWTLSDDDTSSVFSFPFATMIAPGEFVVLFGGGTPTGFGSIQVFTDDGSIGTGLSNSGDTVQLFDDSSTPVLIASYTYGSEGGDDQSLTRSPDGTGGFVKHSTIPPGNLFSPGTAASAIVPELTSFAVWSVLGLVTYVGGRRRL
ncbi:lamin tail domain-containing protein [Bythopirellula goksoeyrii]|nr:lamin tail domain-containing protein [Bythopirellula goksoeyrii]